MASASLAVAAVLDLAVGGLFALIGWRLSLRRVSPDARLASALFATWWYSLAVISAGAGLRNGVVALDAADPLFVQIIGQVTLLALCTALWGLLYYLVYLFTGRRRLIYPITAFYALFYFSLVFLTAGFGAPEVVAHPWTTEVVYPATAGDGLIAVLLVLLLAPQIVGALAYGTLFFRLTDPTSRWRIAIVATSIVVWFGTSYLAAIFGASPDGAWPLLKRLLDTISALSILLAYLPPWFVRERWGVKGIDEPAGA